MFFLRAMVPNVSDRLSTLRRKSTGVGDKWTAGIAVFRFVEQIVDLAQQAFGKREDGIGTAANGRSLLSIESNSVVAMMPVSGVRNS